MSDYVYFGQERRGNVFLTSRSHEILKGVRWTILQILRVIEFHSLKNVSFGGKSFKM